MQIRAYLTCRESGNYCIALQYRPSLPSYRRLDDYTPRREHSFGAPKTLPPPHLQPTQFLNAGQRRHLRRAKSKPKNTHVLQIMGQLGRAQRHRAAELRRYITTMGAQNSI